MAASLVALSLAGIGCKKSTAQPAPSPSAGVASPSAAPSSAASPTADALIPTSAEPSATPLATASVTIPRKAFPSQLGAHYVMRFTDYQNGQKKREWKEDTRLDKADGDLLQYLVTSEIEGQKRVSRIYVVNRPDGLYYRLTEPPYEKGKPTHSIDGATLMFKFPMNTGDSWEMRMPQGSKGERTVMGTETVTVPAGTYKAVRIKEQRAGTSGDSWFVPGVGVVKSDLSGPDGQYVKEMVLFEPAKK